MIRKIKNALISVSDKTKISKLLKILKKYNVEIISSGGTFKKIKSLGYRCKEVSSYTEFNEQEEEYLKLYTESISDGEITENERVLLKTLATAYGIEDERVAEIESNLFSDIYSAESQTCRGC